MQFLSLDAGSVGFEGTRSAESRSTLGKKGQRSSAIATTAGVFYARSLVHGRLWQRSEKRSTSVTLRRVFMFSLYKIAHYEIAETSFESGQF